jgi:hypothetical protein
MTMARCANLMGAHAGLSKIGECPRTTKFVLAETNHSTATTNFT